MTQTCDGLSHTRTYVTLTNHCQKHVFVLSTTCLNARLYILISIYVDIYVNIHLYRNTRVPHTCIFTKVTCTLSYNKKDTEVGAAILRKFKATPKGTEAFSEFPPHTDLQQEVSGAKAGMVSSPTADECPKHLCREK